MFKPKNLKINKISKDAEEEKEVSVKQLFLLIILGLTIWIIGICIISIIPVMYLERLTNYEYHFILFYLIELPYTAIVTVFTGFSVLYVIPALLRRLGLPVKSETSEST